MADSAVLLKRLSVFTEDHKNCVVELSHLLQCIHHASDLSVAVMDRIEERISHQRSFLFRIRHEADVIVQMARLEWSRHVIRNVIWEVRCLKVHAEKERFTRVVTLLHQADGSVCRMFVIQASGSKHPRTVLVSKAWISGWHIRHVSQTSLVMRNIIPVVMAGVLGIYGLIVAVIIQGSIVSPQNGLSQYSLYTGFAHLAAGLCCGLSGLAAGMAIGIVGDAGVRAVGQQEKLFVGMILILIFAEALGLYGT